MVGLSDAVGTEAIAFYKSFGRQARARLSMELSRAIGGHDWDRAHLLQRVNLRLIRMEIAGYFDGGRPAVA